MTVPQPAEVVAAAKARHPASGWHPDRDRVLAWAVARLASRGRPWPAVGARVLAARARSGLDREGFARAAGVTPEELDRVETGAVPPSALPPGVRQLAG